MLTVKLRKEAAAFLDEAKAIQAEIDKEDRNPTDDEKLKMEALIADGHDKIREAKRREGIEQLDAEFKSGVATDDGRSGISAEAKDHDEDGKQGFKFFGEFATVVHAACDSSNRGLDPRLEKMMAATGGSQGVPSDGGFLVPPTFGNEIWDGLRSEQDSLLGMTDNFTVTGESLTFPANAETDRSSGTLYGGVSASWLAEADQISNTKPTFRRIKLEPQELAVLIYETDKLIRNSPVALEQFLSRAASAAINFNVGDAIINGDGSGKPLGILNSSAVVSVAKESGQAADTVLYLNIVKMYARMHAARRGNAVWLINQDVEPQLMNLTQEGTSSSTPVFLPAGAGQFGGAAGAPLATLLGRPVMTVEHCQTVGDVGDIILTDLSAYATGTRGGVESAVSIHLRFDFAETAFRFMFEVDGKPWLLSALTPANGSNTLSTMVTLDART